MLYFLLILVVLLVPFSFRIKAYTENNALIIQAEFTRLFKIKILNKRITVKKIIASLFSKKKSKRNNSRTFNSIKQHVSVEKLNVYSVIGMGDAASTAIVSGQAFGLIAPFAASAAKGKNYNVNILPDYNEKNFIFDGECIISTNLANTIIALAEILGGKRNGKASY